MAEKTWRKRLTRAKRQGEFLDMDRWAANSWLTCAVGEHEDEFQLLSNEMAANGPRGVALRGLGWAFTRAINRNDIEKAESLYKQIQAWFQRSAKRRKARQEA